MATDNRRNRQIKLSESNTTNRTSRSNEFQSAALQDHWTKTLNLDDGRVKKKINHPLPVKRNVKKEKSENKNKNGGNNINEESLVALTQKQQVEKVLEEPIESFKDLSLAQKHGILPISIKKSSNLSDKEWNILKRKAIIRGEISLPCSICKELFTFYKRQILLSCSHTFHLKCIHSFEKYSGKKSCPLCRYKNYKSRLIFDGAHLVSNRAAIKIQSTWRSFTARKLYLTRTKDRIPNHPVLKRRYFESKFLTLADKLANNYEIHNADVDKLIEQINHNISISKSLMKAINVDSIEEKWNEIQTKALNRDCIDCPICLSKFVKTKKMVILTCSHIFHEDCLLSFENYNISDNKSCPVCRSSYIKKSFNLVIGD